jgi:hypothetical protein
MCPVIAFTTGAVRSCAIAMALRWRGMTDVGLLPTVAVVLIRTGVYLSRRPPIVSVDPIVGWPDASACVFTTASCRRKSAAR